MNLREYRIFLDNLAMISTRYQPKKGRRDMLASNAKRGLASIKEQEELIRLNAELAKMEAEVGKATLEWWLS